MIAPDPAGDGIVVLARHGRTPLNADGVLRGHLDPALDAVGEREVRALGHAIAGLLAPAVPVAIVTSPLRRAVQTAQAIADAAPAPIQPARGLIDRDYGPWAGTPRTSVEERFGSLDAADEVERAQAVADPARAVFDAQRPLLATGPVVLVAHDVVNRLLLAGLDPGAGPWERLAQRTACWNLLVRRDGAWHAELIDRKPVGGAAAG